MKQHQEQFDFTRGDQLWLLDHAPFELESVTEGKQKPRIVKVSAAAQRSVLRVIEGHDRGRGFSYPSDATIGKKCNLSERTVRRAIKALEKRQVLQTVDRPGQTRVFVVNWGELSLRLQAGEAPAKNPSAAGEAPARRGATAEPTPLPPDKKFCPTSELVTGTSELVTGTSELSSDEPKETNFKRLRSEGAAVSTDQKDSIRVVRIPAARIAQRVGEICSELGYCGDDAGTLWVLAAAEAAGVLSEHDLNDGVQAAVRTKTSKRTVIGYVRDTIRRNNDWTKGEMRRLLNQVRVSPKLPRTPPERLQARRQKVTVHDGPSANDRRNQVLDVIKAMGE